MLWVLSLALAVDAVAVTMSLAAGRARPAEIAQAALVFGLFQAGMAGAGALGGAWLARWASAWDHWVAFGLLVAVGVGMLRKSDEDAVVPGAGVVKLLALAVATSIDALAAGVSVPLLGPSLAASITTIGLVTTVCCGVGGAIGGVLGAHLGPWMERVGGIVLMLIGLRILVEHLTAGPGLG